VFRKQHPPRLRQPAAIPRMPEFDLPRRLAAEALGTALLVATVVGSGIMAEGLTKDVALALLGNTLPGRFRGRISIRSCRWYLP
jgi:hypothetical protein